MKRALGKEGGTRGEREESLSASLLFLFLLSSLHGRGSHSGGNRIAGCHEKWFERWNLTSFFAHISCHCRSCNNIVLIHHTTDGWIRYKSLNWIILHGRHALTILQCTRIQHTITVWPVYQSTHQWWYLLLFLEDNSVICFLHFIILRISNDVQCAADLTDGLSLHQTHCGERESERQLIVRAKTKWATVTYGWEALWWFRNRVTSSSSIFFFFTVSWEFCCGACVSRKRQLSLFILEWQEHEREGEREAPMHKVTVVATRRTRGTLWVISPMSTAINDKINVTNCYKVHYTIFISLRRSTQCTRETLMLHQFTRTHMLLIALLQQLIHSNVSLGCVSTHNWIIQWEASLRRKHLPSLQRRQFSQHHHQLFTSEGSEGSEWHACPFLLFSS